MLSRFASALEGYRECLEGVVRYSGGVIMRALGEHMICGGRSLLKTNHSIWEISIH